MVETEKVLIKTIGGPLDGETRVVDRGIVGWEWPPPEELLLSGVGCYVRESYSQIPDVPQTEFLMRGAQYQWKDDDGGESDK